MSREDAPDGRRYLTPAGESLPSVTTILQETKSEESKQKLKDWAKRVGEKNAESIKVGAANVGSVLHTNLEKYLIGEDIRWGSNLIQKIAKKMFDAVVLNGISKIDRIYGLEVPLYFPQLYAGTADIILGIDDEVIIGDFKNTIKMKKREWIDDYFIQAVAYGMAHDEMYGTTINKAKILMVARPNETTNECDYEEFEISGEEYQKYKNMWIDKLDQYYAQRSKA